jgi:8-oxo-dGTP diphosphatase
VGAGPEGPRPVTFHPQAAKELGKLDRPIQRQIKDVINQLANGEPTQTHALAAGTPLAGWNSTKASRGHRIVHQNTEDNGIHIGYVGLHDYDKAIRRLTRWTKTSSIQMIGPDEYSRYHFPDYPQAKSLPRLVRHFEKTEPEYFQTIKDEVARDGVTTPVLVRRNDPAGRPMARPTVMQGHHRAAAAYSLGQHLPVGDHDDPEDFAMAERGNRAWFATHERPVPKQAARRTAADDDDTGYRMQHRPPDEDYGAPHHDLSGGGLIPEDVYTHPHYYGDMSDPTVREAHYHISRTRGKPESKVRIYRSLPAEHADQGFRPGDWVTTSKEYARQHGMQEDPKHDWPVISAMVRAKHLHTAGDDFREWGYNGTETKRPMISFKGGYHQEISNRADGSLAPVKRRRPKEAALEDDLYAGWEPHQRAVSEAQEAVRAEHPYLTAPLPDSTDERDEELRKILRQGGHPRADDAYVHVHRDPNRNSSNTGISRETGAPVVALHQSRADRGTIAHEAAHLLNDHHSGRAFGQPAPDHYVHGIGFAQHYARMLQPYGPRTTPGGNYKPGAGDLFLNTYYGSLARQNRGMARTAARALPTDRIFGPTYGLDHRLFNGDVLKPEVRRAVMDRLDEVFRVTSGLLDWSSYMRVYLAGSEASEWTSPTLEGNNDFDTLIGVDYDQARAHRSDQFLDRTDGEIDDILNDILRRFYNDEDWQAPFGGVWHLTGYVNEDAYDIRDIKPYAAYDISNMRWAVKPPHLPSWGPESFPEGPALWHEASAVADYIESILELPEPYRTQQGGALYDHLHSDRHRAFGPNGEGWYDPGNVIEKYLDQLGLWAKLLHLKKNAEHGEHDPGEQPMLEATAAKNTGPLNLARGFPVEPDEGWHPEAADRIMAGKAKPEDILPHIHKDHVGVWWYHPDDADVEDAKEHASGSDETLEKNHSEGETWEHDPHPDLPMIKYRKGHYQGEVAVALEAHHPGGWNPNTDNPTHPLMGNSYLPDHTKLKLHTIHYSPDQGETWHKMHLPQPVDLHTNGRPPGKSAAFEPGPSVHPRDYVLASSDGDDWTACDQGHEHWGTHGAAGLLIRHKDPEDGQTRYLLQKRSPWVDHPDTWGIPGGALGQNEHPLVGAFREGIEELGTLPPGIRRSHTTTDDHGGWAYHTTVADVPERFEPHGGEDDHESDGHGWFTHAEMQDLPLHPGFAKSWDRVRTSHPGNSRVHGASEHWIAREHKTREPGELEDEDNAPPYLQDTIGERNDFFDQVWRQLRPEQRDNVHKNLRAIAQRPLIIGTNHAEKVLDDGHMKTLHEQDPGGWSDDYRANRHNLEHHVMGVPETTSDEHKPIYGALTKEPKDNPYGQHHLELKPHVRARTAMTMGDSLNRNLRGYHIDHVPHLKHDELKAMTDPTELINLAEGEEPKTYGEFQVHGGIGLHDIAKLHVHEDHDMPLNDEDHRVMDKARAAGIEVVHHKPDPNFGLTDEQVATLKGHS